MDSATQEVRAIIDRKNAQIAKWYAEGNVDAIIMEFSTDAWQMPPNQPAVVGRKAIGEYWRRAFQAGRWDFTLRAQDVTSCGPLAVERGTYNVRFSAAPEAWMPSFEDRGNYLVHWRREADGEWRVVADAPVSELPR